MSETVRAFVALDLDEAAVSRIAEAVARARARKTAPRGGWSAAEKLHVTVRFLGDVDADAVRKVGEVLHATLDGTVAPVVRIGDVDGFSRARSARVVYLGLHDPTGALAAIEAKLGPELDALGFASDHPRWVPHLTLARCRQPADLRKWIAEIGDWQLGDATVTSCTLYRSRLGGSHGSTYEALDRVELAPPRNST